jgi:PIN domain nuclease of toxin-antitoxin system
MKYLLDTHVVLWTLLKTNKINKKVVSIIENQSNQIYVSAISFWEISLKYSLGKIDLNNVDPSIFPDIVTEMGFQVLSLKSEEAANYHQLKGKWHRDPFDRMIISICLKNDLVLITKDENIKKYKEEGLTTLW